MALSIDQLPIPDGVTRIEPTADEKRNGWTTETLTRYHLQRRHEQAIFAAKRKRPRLAISQNTETFDPFRWPR